MKTFREFLEIADMQLDEGIRNRDSPKPDKKEWGQRRRIMDNNAKKAEKEASTNNLIRSRKPPEPPTPPRVGGAPYTSSGEGLNPDGKKPRERKVTPYVPPPGTENLKDRTDLIPKFGTVKPEYVPPAAPVKRKKG